MAKSRSVKNNLTAFLLGLVLVAASLPAFAADQTLTGTVSDAMCGMKHKGADAAACMAGCIKGGGSYALVVGDKVYTLKGQEAELKNLGNQKATVTGTVDGMTVAVSSVKKAS